MQVNTEEIPKEQLDSMSKSLLRAVESFFEDPKNREAFEEWQKERDAARA